MILDEFPAIPQLSDDTPSERGSAKRSAVTYTTAGRWPTKDVECVQCGARRKGGDYGKWWPTGAWSCRLCYEADFA